VWTDDFPPSRNRRSVDPILQFHQEIHPARPIQAGIGRPSPGEKKPDNPQCLFFTLGRPGLDHGAFEVPKGRRLPSLKPKTDYPSPMRCVHGVDDQEGPLLCLCLRQHGALSGGSKDVSLFPHSRPGGGRHYNNQAEASANHLGRTLLKESRNPAARSPLEVPPEEMRRLGYEAVDLIVDRWANLGEEPAWQFGTRRELEPLLSGPPPEEGQDPRVVLQRVVEDVLPKAGRIDHPRFFAFIPSSPTWPSVLGDILATGFNIFQGTWLESSGPSQLELVVLDWFRDWLGFPEEGGGILTSGGSAANLVALVTARESAGNPPNPILYVSDQGHSSLERAARIMGFPPENVRKIPTDETFRIDAALLKDLVAEDRAAGMDPLAVCANAGATNTGAIDPMDAIAHVAREENLWFHVDAAYGGFTVLVPGEREALKGIEEADSVTLDPHKWLFQPYETGCLVVRNTRLLEEAFRILPEYLQDTALGKEQVNFADRGIQLSRGFRALKIWMSIQTLGLRAFREAIQTGIDYAREAEKYINRSPALEMMGPSSLGIVCFRFRQPDDDRTPEALEELNLGIQAEIVDSGVAAMSSTRLRGEFSLRLSILNYRSTWQDVQETLEAIEAIGHRLATNGSDA